MAAPSTAHLCAVLLLDGATGDLLADVDAFGTADATAYYLTSRHIDDTATAQRIADEIGAPLHTRQEICTDVRHPITNVLERCIIARVKA
jgi:hypothetical protein